MKTCPHCGGKLRTRTSRVIGSTKESRRECHGCGSQFVFTIRVAEVVVVCPEQVVSIRCCGTTTGTTQTQSIPIE
jgi:hypothetical protein